MQNYFDKIEFAQDKHHELYYKFLRTLTTLLTGLLGLLVALKPITFDGKVDKILFFLTIVLTGTCVLFSLVAQFYESKYFDDLKIQYQHMLQDYMDSGGKITLQTGSIPKPLVYILSEWLTFLSFGLCILSILGYSYVSIF